MYSVSLDGIVDSKNCREERCLTMRILYWYTCFLNTKGEPREYRNLPEFELNLGTKRRYHFDSDSKTLTSASLDPPLPADFWGKGLYNLNALVGENGSGKTAIMHYMMEVLRSLYLRKTKFPDETLMIIEYGKEKVLLHLNPRSDVIFACKGEKPIRYCQIKPDETGLLHSMSESFDPLSVLDGLKVVYHTNTLTLADDERVRAYQYKGHIRNHFVYDCSTSGIMRYDVISDCDAGRTGDNLLSYFQSEFTKQIKYFCTSKQYKFFQNVSEGCKLKLPSQLSIRLRFPENEDFKRIKDLKSFCCSKGLANKIETSKNRAHAYAALLLCCACTRSFERNLKSNGILPNVVPQAEYMLDSLTLENFQRIFRQILREALYDDSLPVVLNKKMIADLYESSLRFIGFTLSKMDQIFTSASLPESFDLGSGEQDFVLTIPLVERNEYSKDNIKKDVIKWLQVFVGHYQKTCKPYYFLDFSWGLSSGESNMLRLFATLYDILSDTEAPCARITNRCQFQENTSEPAQERENDCDSVLLLLDEADLTYHPEWQRRYVSTLTELLPKVFSSSGRTSKTIVKDIQVLFSTHSPLMLGDMPKSNVTYLPMQSAEIESFGENIHLILKNSFFLQSGTLGSFAANKINNTANKLSAVNPGKKESASALDDCRTIIDLLAPGPIRYKLEELYQKAEGEIPEEDQLITRLVELNISKEELMKKMEQLQKQEPKDSEPKGHTRTGKEK